MIYRPGFETYLTYENSVSHKKICYWPIHLSFLFCHDLMVVRVGGPGTKKLQGMLTCQSSQHKELVGKYWGEGGWAELRRGGSSVFEPSNSNGWVVQFLNTHGGGLSCFITGIGTHLTQSTTEVTPSSTKRRKHAFRAVVEKVKSLPKLRSLTDWARSPRAHIFKLLCSANMLVFKEHQMANLCLHTICP